MNDEQLEARLRTWYRTNAEVAEVPYALAALVDEIPDTIPVRRGLVAWPYTRRQATVLIAAALLAGAIAASLALANRPDPALELVRRSQAAHESPPAFSMLTTTGEPPAGMPPWYTACSDPSSEEWFSIHWEYHYDGVGSFRQSCLYGGPPPQYVGGLEIETPDGHGVWGQPEWERLPPGFLNRPAGVPLATPLWLNWYGEDGELATCDAWELGEIDTIAGRSAREVSCGGARYWIDDATALILRRELPGQRPVEILELTAGSPPDSALFTLYEEGFSQLLEVGQVAPEVELIQVDGTPWSSESLRGRRSAVLVGSTCGFAACVPLEEFVDVVKAYGDELSAAVIKLSGAEPYSDSAEAYAMGAGVPVLVDDNTGWPRWEYPLLDGLMLFEPDGRVAALVDSRTGQSMTAAIQAFVTGEPIPPAPPGDGDFVVGEPSPGLTGELLGGGEFGLDRLLGRPSVVIVPPHGFSDSGCESDDLTLLSDLHAALGGEASVMVIAWWPPFGDGAALDGWDARLGEVGMTSSDVLVVAPSQVQDSSEPNADWLELTFVRPEMICDGSSWTAAVLDEAGRVRHLLRDPAENLDELIGLVRGL